MDEGRDEKGEKTETRAQKGSTKEEKKLTLLFHHHPRSVPCAIQASILCCSHTSWKDRIRRRRASSRSSDDSTLQKYLRKHKCQREQRHSSWQRMGKSGRGGRGTIPPVIVSLQVVFSVMPVSASVIRADNAK